MENMSYIHIFLKPNAKINKEKDGKDKDTYNYRINKYLQSIYFIFG